MRLRRLLKFRLRTLLILVTAVAVVFGWFRPYQVELSATDDYGLECTALYRVRRGIFVGEAAFGEQARTYVDGRAIHWMQWAGVPDPTSSSAYQHQYALVDGTIGSEADWRFESLIDLITRTIRPSTGWEEMPPEATADGQ